MSDNLFYELWRRQKYFSTRVFGPNKESLIGPGRPPRGPGPVLEHLESEVVEAINAHDEHGAQSVEFLEELSDIVILTIDAAWRAGFNCNQLLRMVELKQSVNQARKWPVDQDPNKPVYHLKNREPTE